MQKNTHLYLYEVARNHDRSVVDYYVKKYFEDNPKRENTARQTFEEDSSFDSALNNWIFLLAENRELDNMVTSAPPAEASHGMPPANPLMAQIKKDHAVIQQDLGYQLQTLSQEWPEAAQKLVENFVDTLPTPLDALLDEKTKSKLAFMQEKKFDDQLAALDKTMRDNMKSQLIACCTSTAESMQKIPQLNKDFDAEVKTQLRLGNSSTEAREIAINKIIDPMRQLNTSIIIAGNIFSYLEEANKLLKKFLGKGLF
jgi:hypothetical protein